MPQDNTNDAIRDTLNEMQEQQLNEGKAKGYDVTKTIGSNIQILLTDVFMVFEDMGGSNDYYASGHMKIYNKNKLLGQTEVGDRGHSSEKLALKALSKLVGVDVSKFKSNRTDSNAPGDKSYELEFKIK